ncbi:MAG: hemolysin family protein [Isosphaeraceae bacterium]
MIGLSLGGTLGLGIVLLALHLLSVTLTKALRFYSPSRLEEVCRKMGRPTRAEDVARTDERTERASEVLAVVTGLSLAALLGVTVGRHVDADEPYLPFEMVLIIALGVSAAGYVLAGVLGRAFPEWVLDRLWPAARSIRLVTGSLAYGVRQFERFVESLATPRGAEPRPASLEVEIPSDSDHPEETEPELPEETVELIQRAVELCRRDVSELMTPRSKILMLPSTVSARVAARTFHDSGRSRIPIYGENHDDILGILYAKDLFPQLTDAPSLDAVSPAKLVRPAHIVPETKGAYDLLQEMRKHRTHMAVVIDEYGVVVGLISLEDLVEELVGPIDDEHDQPAPPNPVVSLGGSRFEVDGGLGIDELNEIMNLHLPTDGDYQTVGGLAFHALGRVPEPGATFRVDGVEFQVVEIADHSIRRVRIDVRPATTIGTGSS